MRVRTGYSFRCAVGHIEDTFGRLTELGWLAAPISDRASTFGWVRWDKLCRAIGYKPVFGVELAVATSAGQRKPIVSYWSFFAQEDVAAVNRLIAKATRQAGGEPLLTCDQAMRAEGVIRIIGHEAPLPRIEPAADTFVALSPAAGKGFIRDALAAGHRLIASSDNRYPRSGDRPLYELLLGRDASAQTYPQWLLNREEWERSVSRKVPSPAVVEDAWWNMLAAMGACNASLRKAKLPSPAKPATLREMCEAGAAALGVDLTDPVYAERLDRELRLIEQKGFGDYFYIVADIMRYARARLICGPARGSSCGSLVCYLLGITTIDPIPYGLLFERFIDVSRDDLPDIDLDFSDQKRHVVLDYIARKYGADRVARLGTVATHRTRSALTEAAAALDIPAWEINATLDAALKRTAGDERAMSVVRDTLRDTEPGRELVARHPAIEWAARMEGHPRHASQHAAGVVITDEPIINVVAVDDRTGAVMCDKRDAEALGLLKIDALGLTQLSVFEDALIMAGQDGFRLETIPTDDQAAFDVLNRQCWAGVFQFNGMATQGLAKRVRFRSLEDIISVTALARPGPLDSGSAETWARRHEGIEPVAYPHPAFEPYLRGTLGVVIYQEQVMQIAREVGGLSWEEVTALRKAMSKSRGREAFERHAAGFVAGAASHGVPAEIAADVWEKLAAYGGWTFNRSHAVAYGLVSYWCCWLKAHHPHEYAAATLSHTSDPDRQLQVLRELAAEGIEYVPLDEEFSTDKWSVGQRQGRKFLVGPLTSVVGCGPKMAREVMAARVEGRQPSDRALKVLAKPQTRIESLYPIRDAVARLLPDPAARGIVTKPTPIIEAQPNGHDQIFVFFCTPTKITVVDRNAGAALARRGGVREDGPTTELALHLKDDTDTIFAKVGRYEYDRIGRQIVDRGKAGKALYAVKGVMRGGLGHRMLFVKQVRYLGDI